MRLDYKLKTEDFLGLSFYINVTVLLATVYGKCNVRIYKMFLDAESEREFTPTTNLRCNRFC